MGEYARALALATALSERYPEIQIHFALSQEAPYAADTPFPKELLPSSPTFHPRLVSELIRRLRPTLVFFDNAGRTAQLRAARRSGAKIIFVSSRRRQRRKAFRIRWMRMIDEHWIAYPQFIAGAPSLIERAKLILLGGPKLRYLDALLPPPDPELAAAVFAKFDIVLADYILVVPGGGTAHPGAENAPGIVADAAAQIAQHGFPTVLVGVSPVRSAPKLQVAARMPMAELGELIRGARLVVCNGGDTLLQTIACGQPCVAVPIAGDQAHRIAKCERAGLAHRATLDADVIVRLALSVLEKNALPAGHLARRSSAVVNGMEVAVNTIARLSGQA
jgi:hypothetical protein